jgi:hypothetical protein
MIFQHFMMHNSNHAKFQGGLVPTLASGSKAFHSSGQRARAAVSRAAGLPQSSVRARCREVFVVPISGEIRWPDHRGSCAVEVGDRDYPVQDADGISCRVCFSSARIRVCGHARATSGRKDQGDVYREADLPRSTSASFSPAPPNSHQHLSRGSATVLVQQPSFLGQGYGRSPSIGG